MPTLHNQINRFWGANPSYEKFKQSPFVRHIFNKKDADDFIRVGAYLINEAEKLTVGTIPWNENRRLEILNRPRLENAHFSLGAEYFLKGIFLKEGYTINKIKRGTGVNHPLKVRGNREKLLNNEVVQMNTTVKHLPDIIDLSGFDSEQLTAKQMEKDNLKGEKLKGISNLAIPHPNSAEVLGYLHFKRNYALHRPFIVPEFKGITHQLFRFLNYVATTATGKEIKDLADFNNND